MTNSNTVAPTSRPPNEPRPAYVVTNRSKMDWTIWLAVAGIIIFVLGFLAGAQHQQNIFEEAVEKAREVRQSALGAPVVLRVSQWTYKEPKPLRKNPNCALYSHDACPFDAPTPPTQESSSSSAQLA